MRRNVKKIEVRGAGVVEKRKGNPYQKKPAFKGLKGEDYSHKGLRGS